MTLATACSATKVSVLWKSGNPVLMMAASTLVKPSMIWEKPKWTASWRSKVSEDQEVIWVRHLGHFFGSGFPNISS